MEKQRPLPLRNCPIGNICVISAGPDAPACGELAIHTPPRLFSEQSCALALVGVQERIHHDMEVATEASPARYLSIVNMAWSEQELAAVSRDDSFAAERFAQSAGYADMAIADNRCPLDLRIDAAILRAYLPAFQTIRKGAAPTPSDITLAREGLAAIHTFIEASKHTVEGRSLQLVEHLKLEVATLLAAHRVGVFLLPASPREKQGVYYIDEHTIFSESHGRHEAYRRISPTMKLPIRIHNTIRGDMIKGFVKVGFSRFVTKALDNLWLDPIHSQPEGHLQTLLQQFSREDITRRVPDWLAAEASGAVLPPEQTTFLNTFSQIFESILLQQEGVMRAASAPVPRTSVEDTSTDMRRH